MVATEKNLGYKSINNNGDIMGAYKMRRLSAVCVAVFVGALIAGTAAEAFEGNAQPGVRVYLAIPFGSDDSTKTTPAIGLRFGLSSDPLPYGSDSRDYGNVQAFNSVQLKFPGSNFDFRWSLDGKSSTIFNGLEVEETMNALYAAEGEGLFQGVFLPLAVIGSGIAIFVVAKGINSFLANIRECATARRAPQADVHYPNKV